MNGKDFYENNSIIGGQGHFAPDYEESSRDQDRETQKISQVGHTHDRKGNGEASGEGAVREHEDRPPASFVIYPKEAYCASARSRRIPRVSEACKVSLRVAASVAHRKQMRAERAQH